MMSMSEDETLVAKRAFAAATQPRALDDRVGFDIHRWLREVFRSDDLTANTKLVAAALRDYCNGNESVCWPTLDQLAVRLGKPTKNSERLSQNLSELASKGFIQRVKRYDGRAANWVYHLKHFYSAKVDERSILDVANHEAWWARRSAEWQGVPIS
jgi:hypothetical protein